METRGGAAPLDPGRTLWDLLAPIEPRAIGINRLVGACERA
jgi:hypothetical protein